MLTITSFSQNNFIKNDGQLPEKVFSKANFSQGALFVETEGFTYNLFDKKKLRDIHEGFLKIVILMLTHTSLVS